MHTRTFRRSRRSAPAWLTALVGLGLCTAAIDAAPPAYPWLTTQAVGETVAERIPPPAGFERQPLAPGSFGHWLRGLPTHPGRPPVRLFNGRTKANTTAHHLVLDVDVGSRDLQQCADAVIRLRAEFLRTSGRTRDISFQFTSGHPAAFEGWVAGERPRVRGNEVRWQHAAQRDDSYASFRRYLDTVFAYAGTLSLARELPAVEATSPIAIGDVFVQGGSPGHAVLVIDVVVEPRTGARRFLLAQSFMPAQEIHVLNNPGDADLSPWYDASAVGASAARLVTPEWTFEPHHRRRFGP